MFLPLTSIHVTISAPDPQESCQILNAAVEENRLFLIELLQKIEDLSD